MTAAKYLLEYHFSDVLRYCELRTATNRQLRSRLTPSPILGYSKGMLTIARVGKTEKSDQFRWAPAASAIPPLVCNSSSASHAIACASALDNCAVAGLSCCKRLHACCDGRRWLESGRVATYSLCSHDGAGNELTVHMQQVRSSLYTFHTGPYVLSCVVPRGHDAGVCTMLCTA